MSKLNDIAPLPPAPARANGFFYNGTYYATPMALDRAIAQVNKQRALAIIHAIATEIAAAGPASETVTLTHLERLAGAVEQLDKIMQTMPPESEE